MSEYSVKIVHLYPKLLNLYGDKGNIECLRRRLLWRGINVDIEDVCDEKTIDFECADIIFLGGGTEKEVRKAAEWLEPQKDDFVRFAENGGTIIGICEGFELLGRSLNIGGELIQGLGVLDIYTEPLDDKVRFTGDVILECEGALNKVVGFENHNTKTHIGSLKPLGSVLKGNGNDGISGFEGAIYKNVYGTHLHGPLFPKNPELCDKILLNALKKKYSDFVELSPLDDSLEGLANSYIVSRY